MTPRLFRYRHARAGRSTARRERDCLACKQAHVRGLSSPMNGISVT